MSEYRISELAERSGFSASTLRFYDQAGLLPATERSGGGYRLYDEHALERLRFIARGKQLGLPLDEIRELLTAWEEGPCAPVQEKLRQLLTEKISEVRGRIAELTDFSGQLTAARGALQSHPPDGRCDETCGCLAPASGSSSGPVDVPFLGLGPASYPGFPASSRAEPAADRDTAEAWRTAPVACSLASDDQPARVADWQRVLAATTAREPIDGGVRLVFPPDPALAGTIARLAAAEQQCCPFFDFTVELSTAGIVLRARAPEPAQDLIAALFEVGS